MPAYNVVQSGPVLKSVRLRGYIDPVRNNASKLIIHVNIVGESLLENLAQRRSRPAEFYRHVVATEFAKHGLYAESWRWNQNAVCPCGCSPGFVVEVDYETRQMLRRVLAGRQTFKDNSGDYPLTIHMDLELEKNN